MASRKKASKTQDTGSSLVVLGGALAAPDFTSSLPVELQEKFDEIISRDKATATSGDGIPRLKTPGGQFSFNGEMLGTELAVVPLGIGFENLLYEGAYNPSDPGPPDCGAVGVVGRNGFKSESDLAPPASHKGRISDLCEDCKYNAWASADDGKGKKCGNRRRVAFIAVPPELNDGGAAAVQAIMKAEIISASVPPTSLRELAAITSMITSAESMARPLCSTVIALRLIDNPTGGLPAKIWDFELLATINEGAVLDALYARAKEAEDSILLKEPNFMDEDKGKKKGARKTATRGGRKTRTVTKRPTTRKAGTRKKAARS